MSLYVYYVICFSNTQSGGDSENGILKMSSSNINKSWGGVMAVRNSLKVRTQECLKSRKNEKNASFNNNPVKKKNKRELECINNADGTGTFNGVVITKPCKLTENKCIIHL